MPGDSSQSLTVDFPWFMEISSLFGVIVALGVLPGALMHYLVGLL